MVKPSEAVIVLSRQLYEQISDIVAILMQQSEPYQETG
jgi:hypothetical protein